MMRLVNIASWKGMGAPPFYGAPFLLLRTTSMTLRCRRNEVVLLFKSTTSCSPGDSFGTRETGDRRHVPPRLTRIGGPASIGARLCVRAESKLLQESRCQHTQLEQADRHRSEVENWPHLACPVRRVREAVVRKPAQIGWAANPWTGWCRIAIADDSGAK